MEHQQIVLNIAGLRLKLDCANKICLPKNFEKFILRRRPIYKEELAPHFLCRRPISKEELGSLKPLDSSASYKLKHFDDRLISYLYSQRLSVNQGLLIHAAAIAKGGRAFLFFAQSGGGKSTVADLSRSYQVLGDDVIALRRVKNDYYAFATPWKQRLFINQGSDTKVKVSAMFFLKKSRHFSLKPVLAEEALARLLNCHTHFFSYTARDPAKKIFVNALIFSKKVPAYELSFNKKHNFWPRLEEALGGIQTT